MNGRGINAGFQNLVRDGLRLPKQVVGKRKSKQQLVSLASFLRLLGLGQLSEPVKTRSLDLKELVIVFLIDRFDCLARRTGARRLSLILGSGLALDCLAK